MIDNAAIINELLEIEAWAAGLTGKCRKTIALLQKETVSTATAKQPGLSREELAAISAKRHARVLKNALKAQLK
jgi:hypothetical protein